MIPHVVAKLLVCFALLAALGHISTAQTPIPFPGAMTVGQSSSPLTVSVAITGNGTAAAPQAVTQGIAGLDFSLAAGGTCAPGLGYLPGQSCTVSVVFQPKAPGRRLGAVVLKAIDGTVLGSTLLTGVGQGGLGVLQPGQMDTLAGSDTWIYKTDGVPANGAAIFLPEGVVVDAAGNIYLSDTTNNRVRRVDAVTGLISTVAGNGIPGFAGDGGLATKASINQPVGLQLDGAGNLFFVDSANHVVRRVDAVSQVITTVAGVGGVCGYTGDSGPANAANLCEPSGIAFDAGGNLYIGDTGNNVVRRVDAVNGNIGTVAGLGPNKGGYNGDGILATTAELNAPWSVAIGLDGALYITDRDNNRIRKVDSTGTISTVAGTGRQGFGGDGGNAKSALLNSPAAVAFDPAGNMYIADSGNNRVRKVTASTGLINTITGTGDEGFTGDAGPANLASVYGPIALYFDGNGNLLIADMFHNRIRRISATTIALQYATIRVGKTSPPQLEGLENDGNASLAFSPPAFLNAALDPASTTCTATLPSDLNCTYGVEFAPTVIGNPVLGSVTQPSDAGNSPDVINLSGEVLTVEPTTIALTSNDNPSLLGASVIFTATVFSADKSRGGPVTFFDGATAICSDVPLNGSGAATCATSSLTLGQHAITADYAGDANNAAANSSKLTQTVQQPTTAALVVSPNPSVVGTPVLLAVTVTGAGAPPTGVVTFYDGATAIGTANLVSGVGNLSTSALTPGTHNITAKYAGDSTNAAGTSNDVSEVVSQGTTSATIATSSANVTFGTSVVFTATVISISGPAPTGQVQFLDGTNPIGAATLSASGIATLAISSLAPGIHNIVAFYVGDTDDAATSSAPLAETVQGIATTTVLTSGKNPAMAGALVPLSAKVAIAAGAVANGPITGTVTFSYGAATLGTAPVNGAGVATMNTISLPVGSDAVIATYSGDSNYTTSKSSALAESITVASATLMLSGPATVDVLTPATFTMTFASGGPAPAGILTLSDGATVINVQSLTTTAPVTFATSSLSLGSHTLTATFSGDPDYAKTPSNAIAVTVQQGPTQTALVSGNNPQTVGQSITFITTVTSASPNITGAVTLKDGATSLGSAPVNAAGVATFTLSNLAFGSHNLTATYPGDTNHTASTSPMLTQKIVQAAAIALTSTANPVTASTNVTFSVQLTGTPTLTPSGLVTFLDGATVLGTGTLNATGAATFATNALFVGSHNITASYAGDTNFAAVTSTVLVETVQNASTQIALTASSNPSIYLTPLTLTATITTNGAVATGSVTFTDGGTSIGTQLLNGSGVATLTLSTLTPGPHSISASYGGDSETSPSISVPLALSVKEQTSISIASNANPALTLTPILLSVAVVNSGVGAASGTVTFTDGSTPLGTATLDGLGHATLTVPSLSAGNHPITASYSGDTDDLPSSTNSFAQAVQLRPTVTALTATATGANEQVTLISVVRWTGATTPTGTITFTSGTTVLGSAPVDATGVATMTIFVQSGTQSIVASYSGDAFYAGSDSLATSITGAPPTQFTLTVDPPTMTVQTKQHGVVNITIASVKGFTDTLDFGCLGLPFAATCTFSTTQLNLEANGTHTIQLTVDTGNPLGSGALASNAHGSGSNVLMCFLPGMLLIGFVLTRRKRNLPMLSIVVLVLGMGAMLSATGCAGLQESGTPPGTYTFRVAVTGTTSGATESTPITLTVTQ